MEYGLRTEDKLGNSSPIKCFLCITEETLLRLKEDR